VRDFLVANGKSLFKIVVSLTFTVSSLFSFLHLLPGKKLEEPVTTDLEILQKYNPYVD
jgi:hypothetical protein